MTFDDFAQKLRQIKADHLKTYGRPLCTIAELENVLSIRMIKSKKKGLKSLRGIID